MAGTRIDIEGSGAGAQRSDRDVRLMFYVGVPVITALLFGLNRAGMARLLPDAWAVPYWIGLALPLWLLLDGCTRLAHRALGRYRPHRWLLLFLGSLIAMAVFSFYVDAYAGFFAGRFLAGQSYSVATPFPEAFLDLRRFVAYSGVPIYWIAIALFFARYFRFPPYVVAESGANSVAGSMPRAELTAPATNAFGLPERTGFLALVPFHLGTEVISLRAEDHYVRVMTDKGNALIRYRFADALAEVRSLPGIQVHRSHWVATRAIERVRSDSRGYHIILNDGSEAPVSRTNIGVLKAAGLI